jgi:hypothetical protein
MPSRLVALCVEAVDPDGLARFWTHALRGDTALPLVFPPVPEKKVGKNRIHLDLTTTSFEDQAQTIEQLLALGARHIDVGQRPDEPHVVLADPEGNELCIIEPQNSVLAGCGRLGSITCDGSPRAGYLWSAALGWPLVWDQDEETAIRAPDGTGPFVTWGPPVPVKTTRNRLHLDIAPDDGDKRAEVERLLALGATRLDAGGHAHDVDGVTMADPDGNEFCVVTTR